MFNNVELRKLPAGSLYRIVDILETNSDWKKVMSFIPKNPESDKFEPKYNNEAIRLIEEHAKATSRKCAEIMLEEWGTSGKIRPTLTTLKKVIIQAQIFRAADEIAIMMQEAPPKRPDDGPAAPVDINITQILEDESVLNHLNKMGIIGNGHFEHTTRKLERHTDDLDKAIGNRTTAQMKSATDLIKFSGNMASGDIPNLSALQSLSNKTTKQMKSDTNLIQFSKIQTPIIQVQEPTLDSQNIPNFSAINSETSIGTEQSTETVFSATESEIDSTAYINETLSQDVSQTVQSSDIYQMSLPNIDINIEAISSSGIDRSILQDENLIKFKYEELKDITNNFSEQLITGPTVLSGRIGSGGFGEVFVGVHLKYGPLAVKKAHNYLHIDHKPDTAMKVFNAEVKFLSQFRHKNIVPIIGLSIDGPAMCMVCEYVEGGSLEQKLYEKILNERQRISIMIGTAEGLKYLHGSEETTHNETESYKISETESQNSKKNNFVHGDVKSANILLTKDCTPKLCDFGLAKQFDSTFVTTSLMGTSAYMAPEGFSGTITQKIDIYSYGIVLLELLTGLKPIISQMSEKINIKDYIEENSVNNDITNFLDPIVINWNKANEIYDLAKKCLERQRKSRPSIDEVCEILYETVDRK